MNLSLKRRSVQNRRLIATSTLCVLAGLLASLRQSTPAKAEHSLPPVIRLDIDNNDNAVVPACRTITSYLNHAANLDARTSWQIWASGNECEALNDRVAQKDELELYHIYHVLERKDGFVCVVSWAMMSRATGPLSPTCITSTNNDCQTRSSRRSRN